MTVVKKKPTQPQAPGGKVAPARAVSVVGSMLRATLPTVLLVQLTASIAIEVANFQFQKEQLARRIERIAENRAPLIAEPLWKMRYDQIEKILNEIMMDEAVIAASVLDDTGTAVASSPDRKTSSGAATVTHPITYRDGQIKAQAGSIVIAFDEQTMYADVWHKLRNPLIVGILATLAMLVALKLAAGVYVGRPLAAMMAAIRRSEEDGRNHKAEFASADEFGRLARSFNKMQEATSSALEELERLASHDALTGLPNRRALNDRLKLASKPASANGSRLAMHFIDLDDFKAINDTFGHEAGDKFLVHVASQLRGSVRAQDWVVRLGGDEFIVLQQDVPDEAAAHDFAREILERISVPLQLHGKNIVPRASIGIAVRDLGDPDVAVLPALADVALYHAKSIGPGSIAFLNEGLQRAHARRRELELAIGAAFAERQFEVWYQSQIDLATGREICLEALIRWRHPEQGIIAPDEFLPLIARSGNSNMLALFVLENACIALKRLAAAGRSDVRIAINLSPSELADDSFAENLQAYCRSHGVPVSAFELEITEGSLINNVSGASKMLARMRDMGATIALDDFGTGYSALAYLRRFPLDKIKIDKAFIRDLPGNAEDRAIVEIVVALARKLRLTVVAEGIERPEQARAMADSGVTLGQGYMYHRPQPIEGVLAFLDERTGHRRPGIHVAAG